MKKKKGKDYSYKRTILVGTMMISLIISMSTYWMYAYKHKHGYTLNEGLVSIKVSDYASVSGDIVVLKNVDNKLITEFTKEQNSIIRNNKIIDMNITNGIYKNILSIKINYIISNNLGNYEEVLTLNIDLKENKIITNEELLNMIEVSYKDIATDIFNEYIKIPSDKIINVTDSINENVMTSEEFNNNSEKYIVRIREKLPDVMKIYINDSKVYYVVRINDINKICYYTDNNMNNINKEIGSL